MNTSIARCTLVALALAAAGCSVEKVGTVDLTGVCAWPDAESCEFSGACDMYTLGRPYVYAQVSTSAGLFANELILPLEVRNQVVNNEDKSSGQSNSNDAYIKTYELSFASDSFSAAVPSVPYPATASRIPAEGTAVTVATVIPWTTMQSIAGQLAAGASAFVRVDIRLKGSFGSVNSGRDFETGTMSVLVQVINAAADDTTGCPAGETITASCPPGVLGQSASLICEAPAAP